MILYTLFWYSISKVMLLLNWPLGIVVQLLQWRIRPLWHVYERDKLLSWLQKKITITRLKAKAYVSEEILNWYCLSLSLNADRCIHFYWLSRLRQARHRKMIQSSALRLWLCHFKIFSDTSAFSRTFFISDIFWFLPFLTLVFSKKLSYFCCQCKAIQTRQKRMYLYTFCIHFFGKNYILMARLWSRSVVMLKLVHTQ